MILVPLLLQQTVRLGVSQYFKYSLFGKLFLPRVVNIIVYKVTPF